MGDVLCAYVEETSALQQSSPMWQGIQMLLTRQPQHFSESLFTED